MFVRVRPGGKKVIFAKGTSVSDRVISASAIFQKSNQGTTSTEKTLHKLRFANRNPSGLDPFLDLLFGAKINLFSLFFAKKNTKSTPIYSCRK